MYTISFDKSTRTLHIVTEGFWTPGVSAAFWAEVITRGTVMRLQHGQFAVLADLRRAAIQPAGIIDTNAAMMPHVLKLTSLPIAAVVATTLAKLQSERCLNAPNCRTFLDIDEARNWLATVRTVKGAT